MTASPEDFPALVARARRGESDALAELAQRYEPKLRRVAKARLGRALRPYLDTVDLLQSVHVSLLHGLQQDKFDISTPEQLLALALTMVRRKVAQHWRRLQRQQRLSHGPASVDQLAVMLSSLSSPETNPAQEAEAQDQLLHLCKNLDATDQRLLDLRLQGHNTVEIAQELGMQANVLRVRLSRLRRRLHALGVAGELF